MDNTPSLQNLRFKQLIREIAKRTNLTITEIEPIVRTVFDCIKYFIYEGNKVTIPKFGVFKIKKRKAMLHRLARIDNTVWKDSYYTPTFRFAFEFKKQVRKIEVKDDNSKGREMDN